ncbi:MAG: hypothetical protein QOD07_1994 [Frankiaceae bacterium]|jgi:hypothetical protein|nr:hypothetical protein [Frankiaceae bacterium]
MRRVLPALAAGFAILLPPAAVPSPAAAATSPTFDSVSWKYSALTISGLAMVAQTGTVHVTDPGVPPGSDPNACRWYFHLTSTGGSGTVRRYTTGAKLTSGTVNDGTWTMTFYLSSTADGTWHLTGAETCSAGPSTTYAVSGGAAFTVVGHHQPRVSWGVVPTPVRVASPRWSLKGRVYDADTGAGMPGVTVGQATSDTSCLYQQQGEGPGASLSLRTVTNANGYYALPARALLPSVGVRGADRGTRVGRVDGRRRRARPRRPVRLSGRPATTPRIDHVADGVDGEAAHEPAFHAGRAAAGGRSLLLPRVLPAVHRGAPGRRVVEAVHGHRDLTAVSRR